MCGLMRLLPAVALFLTTQTVAGAIEVGTCICRNGIVSKGDLQAEVLHKCGPPTQSFQRQETRIGRGRYSTLIQKVTVEDWTYNFGPNEFMYNIQFENGRVERIESLDYGY